MAMFEKHDYILSICIPTYNRAVFLAELLSSLITQLSEVNAIQPVVELIILDNYSSDNTPEICHHFINKVLKKDWFKYVRHPENIGMDGNFKSAYTLARGSFFWMIGDDDDIIDNGMQELIPLLLREQNSAMIYLESKFISRSNKERYYYKTPSNKKLTFHSFNSNENFSKTIGINFTFISSIIVNKSLYPVTFAMMDKLAGTYLLQLTWIFQSLKNGNKFIYVKKPFVIAEPNNSGGYNVFRVFSENFLNIVKLYFHNNSRITNIFKTESLYFVMPFLFNKEIGRNFDISSAKLITNSCYSDLFIYKKIFKLLFRFPAILKCFYHITLRIHRLLH
jgi:glycosyltransferase involved in cell wall biosynthesis